VVLSFASKAVSEDAMAFVFVKQYSVSGGQKFSATAALMV
jgi:hypothetical protein